VASWKRTARFSRVGSALIISALLFLAPALELFAAQTPPSESDAILNHLNRAISWYRLVIGLDVTAGQPSDTLYLENARNSATQALQYAFQAALAEAALLQASDKNKGTNTAANNQSGDQQQGIANALSDIDNRIQQAQSQLQVLDQQLDKSKGKDREQLLSQRDTLQGELNLDKTIQESLQKISTVATGAQTATTGITAQVEQLKQSIPEVFANTSKKQAAANSGQNSKAANAQNSGLLGLLSILFSQMRDVHDIDDVISQTTALSATADKLDAPLRAQLKNLIQQGRSFLNQPPATDPKQVAAMRAQFQSLTGQFKQIADAAVPLRQEIILLDDTKGELVQWRDSIEAEYARVLRDLLTRVVGIFIALAFVLLLSELWRRATRRYIRDARRRRQLTIIRRVVVGFLMFLVVAAGFASEFSSLATFAGFLTAGIAVALQTVILSVAAYFFLIGRYGVRVGDRISVSGVTGDVIEIGLIRLYLMELSGTGIDLYPTGRVVVFSNSVMFQTAPFFKQLPGTAYAWHELAVTLANNTDLSLVEKKLMDAVNSVFSQYRHNIDRQHALVERILDTPIAAPAPVGKVQFSDTGLEFAVRYPVEIQHAAEIDDQVTRKLLEVIEGDPQLKGAVSASPKLRAAIKA
jgi:small-conductance mechanosensitive channel